MYIYLGKYMYTFHLLPNDNENTLASVIMRMPHNSTPLCVSSVARNRDGKGHSIWVGFSFSTHDRLFEVFFNRIKGPLKSSAVRFSPHHPTIVQPSPSCSCIRFTILAVRRQRLLCSSSANFPTIFACKEAAEGR